MSENTVNAKGTVVDDAARRAKNIETIKQFVWYGSKADPNVADRTKNKAKLYYGEGSFFKIVYYFEGHPNEFHGLDEINKQEDINQKNWKSFDFQIDHVYECVDPDQLWVKFHGLGVLAATGTEVILDPLIIFFQMKEGKILGWEEHFNPLAIYTQAGIKLPVLY